RPRDTTVAQEQREDRREGCEHYKNCGHYTGRRSVEPLHKNGNDKLSRVGICRFTEFLPWDDGENRDVHHDIDRGNRKDRINDSSGDRFLRILYLAGEEVDIVVTPVVVNRNEQSRAQAQKERRLQRERTRREGKGNL